MKSQNRFAVVYNLQTAVDSETHLIRDYEMTNQVTDHGLIDPTMKGIREDTDGEILEVVSDKGYKKDEDMISHLENGIIPNVILDDEKDNCEFKLSHEESEASTSSKYQMYKGVITDIEVKEV